MKLKKPIAKLGRKERNIGKATAGTTKKPKTKKKQTLKLKKFMPKSQYVKLCIIRQVKVDMEYIKTIPVRNKTGKTFGQIAEQYLPKYAALAKA